MVPAAVVFLLLAAVATAVQIHSVKPNMNLLNTQLTEKFEDHPEQAAELLAGSPARNHEQVVLTARAAAKQDGRPARSHKERVDRIKTHFLGVADSSDSTTSPRVVRKNVLHLTDAELTQFTNSVLIMKTIREDLSAKSNFSLFDRYAWAHNVGANYANIHWQGQILPWHREWLLRLEFDLQNASGNKSLAVPYWDIFDVQTRDAVFADNIMGGNGTVLMRRPGKVGGSWQVVTGPYAQWEWNVNQYRLHRIRLTRCLGCATHLPPLCIWAQMMSEKNYDYPPFGFHKSCNTSFTAWLSKIHLKVHQWQLHSDFFKPGADPLTMLIHSFLDKIWMIWQMYYYGDGDDGLWGYRPGWHWPADDRSSPSHGLWFYNTTIADVLNPLSLPYTYKWKDRVDGTFLDVVNDATCRLSEPGFQSNATSDATYCMDDQSNFECSCTSLPSPFVE